MSCSLCFEYTLYTDFLIIVELFSELNSVSNSSYTPADLLLAIICDRIGVNSPHPTGTEMLKNYSCIRVFQSKFQKHVPPMMSF